MQLPDSIGAVKRHLWGRYPMRALTRDGLTDLVEKIGVANEEIRSLARQLEDLQISVENALCDRDQVDGDLDELARSVRNQLLVRGTDKEEPYLSLFPNGLGEYVDAKIGDELKVYGLLTSRLEEHLELDDPVRVTMVPKIVDQLAVYGEAVKAQAIAEQATDAGARRYARAVVAWESVMLEVHAVLLARTRNRKKADRYFPKARKSVRKAGSAADPTEAPAPEPVADSVPAADPTIRAELQLAQNAK